MLGHWTQVLTEVVRDPAQPVDGLELLSRAERRQVVDEWNRTTVAYPTEPYIHDVFAAQAAATPDAIAVVSDDDEAVSYGALNARANQLAWYLRACGVGPDVRVGVYLERSVAMIVALLGVLKAGGAYVPLDPEYPAERVQFMVDDAAAPVLLTQARLCDQRPAGAGRVIVVDQDAPVLAQATGNLPRTVAAADAAYVIYTSGSTGTPKGAVNTHAGILNRLHWMQATYGLDAADRVLQKTPISFDVSVWELFWPLMTGARLVLARPGGHRDAPYLSGLIAAQGITVLHFVPSMLAAFLRDGAVGPCATVRDVICSGEALPGALVAQCRQRWPGARVHNLYGPTEAAVDVTAWACAGAEGASGSVPIGRPIANTQLYVVDGALRPVPVGVAGEVYIGGVGLARGYGQRAALTAERFVPNPFGGPGTRLYRTGDRGRWRADGALEFLGRLDHQVKIRGQRVELGEIESVLRAEAGVRDAVVLAREETPGDLRLVAYVVGDELPSGSRLRARLRARLPESMIPAAFVALAAWPLTANGKLDRQALPAPSGERTAAGAYVAPRTATEELLCGIWARVLRVAQVGVDDNFFELGGHSLLATKVMAQTRKIFGIELPLRRLFDVPTVTGLAEAVETARRTGALTTQPPLVRVTPRDTLPLSYEQQQLWVIDQLEPGSAAYNMPIGSRLHGRLDVDALERALREVTRRHEALRTYFETQGGRPVQVVEPTWRGHLVRVNLQHLDASAQEHEVRRLATDEAVLPFDLSRGPLLRTQLLVLSDCEHVLLVTMHHIISDGWSMGVMVRELGTLYAAFQGGEPLPPLSELDVQYADYAAWQRAWLQGEVVEAQLRYWKRQLADVAVLELPTDRRRPSIQTFRGDRCSIVVPPAIADGLRALSRRESVTVFMTLLAAFQALLQRYTGVTDIAIGTPIAGRQRPELDTVVGLFLNTLVLRTNLAGNLSVHELLHRVRQTTLEAYANQDVTFEQVIDAVQPQRDLSRNPLFQVMLIYQSGANSVLCLPGMTADPLEAVNKTAKLDLTAFVVDADELSIALEYNVDLFDSTTITRMLGHWTRVLEEMARDAAQPVWAVDLLSPEERQQVVEVWNRTVVTDTPDACLHELFEAQAAMAPDAVAVLDDAGQVSYGKLAGQATQTAQVLRTLALGPGDCVAVCMERSTTTVAALLGILQCGAAYVPVEPSLPRERMAAILATVRAKCVVADQSTVGRLAALPDELPDLAAVLGVDGSRVVPEVVAWHRVEAGGPRVPRRSTADDLAYVIFTSGSTGVPKGVGVTHRAAANLIDWGEPDVCGGAGGPRAVRVVVRFRSVGVRHLWAAGGGRVGAGRVDGRDA
ncbi:MAG TPA: amino acid adenylation domain-containing protein, partial [Mycobacterium sp.]|nr:amino acid adenylation domain-containing protein [Mycobacterium sp.]